MVSIEFSKADYIRHSLIWVIISIILQYTDPFPPPFLSIISGLAVLMADYMAIYYFLFLFVLPVYWKRNYVILVALWLLAYLFHLAIVQFDLYFIVPATGGPKFPLTTLFLTISNSLLPFIIIGFVAVASFNQRRALAQLKDQSEREKQMILEQLNFLRDQFNSHMTFNFLNFCYAKVLPSSTEAAEAIELYTNMLNYSLLIKPDEKVSLEKEVTFITEYIGLQKCLHSKACIEYTQEGSLESIQILPRILINFVENAFKHGQFTDSVNPIRIKLISQAGKVIFRVQNRKDHSKKVKASGIGKKNMGQILDLRYKGQYELNINETAEDYSSEFILST